MYSKGKYASGMNSMKSLFFFSFFFLLFLTAVYVLVAQWCPTLCDSVDCSPPGSSVHGIPGKNTGVGCHSLLQGIFPTLGSNSGLLHCRRILYHLSHQGSYSLGKRKHEMSSTHFTPARMTYFRITSPSFLKFKKKMKFFSPAILFWL